MLLKRGDTKNNDTMLFDNRFLEDHWMQTNAIVSRLQPNLSSVCFRKFTFEMVLDYLKEVKMEVELESSKSTEKEEQQGVIESHLFNVEKNILQKQESAPGLRDDSMRKSDRTILDRAQSDAGFMQSQNIFSVKESQPLSSTQVSKINHLI